MHYELYVDSLFFINFIMNLYLLILVDRSTLRTATPGRLAAGAAVGAACFLLPFAGGGPVPLKLGAGLAAGTVGMLCVTFPVKNLRMFLRLLERLALYSFGLGGLMLFLIKSLPFAREEITGVLGLAGAGGLAFLAFCRLPFGAKGKNGLCRATLCCGGTQMSVNALIDSGNGLAEPISGKPVCVVGKEVFGQLMGDADMPFRAIPYHSIGRKRGIMKGYLLPELRLEVDGLERKFVQVYVAVSENEISGAEDAGAESVKMIINPRLFSEGGKGAAKKRQNERQNDSESDITG